MPKPIPEIDYSRCTGCGACAEVFPQFFRMRDERAWLINHECFDPEKHKALAYVCPFRAIRIEDNGAE